MIDIKQIKLQNNIEEAIYITNNKDCKTNYMGSYSKIVGSTNENQYQINDILNFKDKKVLLTGSSADQYLSSIFFGSREETIYDINALAEFYIYLKISAIRNLKYEDFIEFILPYINKEKYLNVNLIKQLIYELPPYIKEFWISYLSEVDSSKIGNLVSFLDNDISNIKNKTPYYIKENYYTLKKILTKKDYPKFIETDISYFEYSIKDNYDIISLSNIIECNQQPFDDVLERKLYTDEEWIEYIKTVIYKQLNSNGKILVFQTIDWNSEQYVNEGFEKYTINNNKEKNIALVLKK
ncbi:MAG: hypothetical protein E7166_01215 [Firmicutes bacterium]|nr:hypothetical protein [Bacillota bacterium]